MQQHGPESRLVALGANMAGLAEAFIGLGAATLFGAAGAARRTVETMLPSPAREHDHCGCSRGCHSVRHHYCCTCVPPCYGCGC